MRQRSDNGSKKFRRAAWGDDSMTLRRKDPLGCGHTGWAVGRKRTRKSTVEGQGGCGS